MSQPYPGDDWVSEIQNQISDCYRAATPPQNPDSLKASVWIGRTLYDIGNGQDKDASWARHKQELLVALGEAVPFPPAPTRDQVCAVRIPFQGCTFHSAQYGAFPMFGPETSTLNDADLDGYFDHILNLGYSHCEFALSWNYQEHDYQFPVPGRDLSQDLGELRRRAEIAIRKGLFVVLFLAGDGRSQPKGPDGRYPYNDPQGWTYGCEWLTENLARVIHGLDGSSGIDLTPYVVFCPGYDGVFYGWGNNGTPDLQPTRVADFAQLFRALLPAGHLALEHSTGHIPLGEGGSDFLPGAKMMQFDVILSEFNNWPETGDPTWQIAARMLGAAYRRPSNQTAGDDLHPPAYVVAPTPRGPLYRIAYEYATYSWVRGRLSAADVQKGREYYQALGYGYSYVC